MSFFSNSCSNISKPDFSNDSNSILQNTKQFPENNSKNLYVDPKTCLFCPKLASFPQTFFMLNKALFLKYSSSQNYYYTKDIQEFIDNTRKSNIINFKDSVLFEEKEEYLTRIYRTSEHNSKLSYLTEYYKYHKEVPRLFMTPCSGTINHFHDKKRRIEYYKIKRMLAYQKKGVIVTGNKEEEPIISDSEANESSLNQEKKKKDPLGKPISRILEHLDSSLNRSLEKSEKENNEKNKKKFTINKNIKSKLQPKLEELYEKKKETYIENSINSLQEIKNFLDKVVVKPKQCNGDNHDEENQTLIPTEITDIFFEDEQTIINTNQEDKRKINELKINLEELPKNEKLMKSVKENPHEILLRKVNSKPLFPSKNNFLSPKNTVPASLNFKTNQYCSEKINEKFTPLENLMEPTDYLKKSQEKLTESLKNDFKKKKSYSINSAKNLKPEIYFTKIIDQKANLQTSHTKNQKYFSPEKNIELIINKPAHDLKLFTENKLKKVEKFIKIYKSNITAVQKPITNRESGQNKTSNLSNHVKENSETVQSLSKMSNSKSFSEKQNQVKHRRINSSTTALTSQIILSKYQKEMPLGKVTEILFKNKKNGSNPNINNNSLKIQNNNTLHRKMPSEIYTPKEKPIQIKPNLFSTTESKFFNNQIMSRSQVNKRIKHFNNGTIHLSSNENLTDLKRARNKSSELSKKTEIILTNHNTFTSKNNNKKSYPNTSVIKESNIVNNNLKHNINARENINPG